MPPTDERATDASLAARARQIETLDRLSRRFGQSLSDALGAGASGGRELSGVLDRIAGSLGSALAGAAGGVAESGLSAVLGAASRSLAESVLGAGFRGAMPFAMGGIVGGPVMPFASGGVVAAPSFFPLGRGLGLAGEAGPEAILPLRRGPDGRLGVGVGGSGPATNVTVHIAASDVESFRRSEAQVAAALARAVARGRRAL